jgi:hypothetical protein
MSLRRVPATGVLGCPGGRRALFTRFDQLSEVDGIPLRLVLVTIVEEHVQPLDARSQLPRSCGQLPELDRRIRVVEALGGAGQTFLCPCLSVPAVKPKDAELRGCCFPDLGHAAREALRLINHDMA